VLAYVFWHRPKPAAVGYERALRRFLADLQVTGMPGLGPVAGFAVGPLPWLPGGSGDGYEDWYLVDDFAALGRLNVTAVGPGPRAAHDRAAAGAAEGAGGVYALRSGPAEPGGTAHWFAKPAGLGYSELDALVEGLGTSVWQRQMTLGPAPEFCLTAPGPLTLPDELGPVVTVERRALA
jgi:hypothetical protein